MFCWRPDGRHSKVDGATLWLDSASPVVAISSRYDRVDWFWFTLIHELIHVRNGDGKEHAHADVGLVGEGSVFPEAEERVNAAAAEFLIPQAELSNFIARIHPLYSRERVQGFAGRLKIHPGLVVGQLQHQKRISQAHLRDLTSKVA